jgi:hypothetical protein
MQQAKSPWRILDKKPTKRLSDHLQQHRWWR